MVSVANMCIQCKGGKMLCGWRTCPLLPAKRMAPSVDSRLSQDYFGPSTSVFVGHNFYPNVYAGPVTALETERLQILDSPSNWFGRPYGELIEMRSLLLRSKTRENVFSRSRDAEKVRELALATRPTDVELSFRKRPAYDISFNDIVQPMGPSGTLKSMEITENPHIPEKVEKVVSDELKASEASWTLYRSGIDISKVMVILSSGSLGVGEGKKLVPTRWSITAMDDMLAKKMMEDVRERPSVNEYLVYESEYLDNHFVIMLMPGSWEFENFEAWSPGSSWGRNLKKTEITQEHEPFGGRKAYAYNQAGGYYAARFSVVSALQRIGRQARVVSFREVSEGYAIPMGVWVVRATSEDAMKRKPARFATREEALRHVSSRLRLPLEEYAKQSVVLRQRRLGDF